MLSTGIKNSFLIVTIILIFHFLIKNVMLTRKHENFKCLVNDDVEKTQDTDKDKDAPKPVNLEQIDKPRTEKEIYDSWFSDDTQLEDDASLDKYFEGELDIKKEIEQATKCPLPVTDPKLPLSSTCDVNFEKVPQNVMYKDIKADCNIKQDKSVMIISEYENENNMNGGKLYMDLSAFDYDENIFASPI